MSWYKKYGNVYVKYDTNQIYMTICTHFRKTLVRAENEKRKRKRMIRVVIFFCLWYSIF